MFDNLSRLKQCQLGTIVTTFLSNLFLFIATVTPAWQVAYDLDVNSRVDSGLWMYCPGNNDCWYIFSDALNNYYEKVDVCRFLLIGDCRKKLLRTPFFFPWHYIVLYMNIVVMCLLFVAFVAAVLAYIKPAWIRKGAIIFDILLPIAGLLLAISLAIFMANAEMLESKYLIGHRRAFEKEFGYSFYIAGFALLFVCMACLAAILVTTYSFFVNPPPQPDEFSQQSYNNTQLFMQQQNQYTPQKPLQSAMKQDLYRDKINSTWDTGTATPGSQMMQPLPMLDTTHGIYIPPARSPTGQFVPNTRHFYSYS